jgi:hypothetical protein
MTVIYVSKSFLQETKLISNENQSTLEVSNIYPTRCNVMQFILSGNRSTCFSWYLHPSSAAQPTVSIASGICHTVTAWQIPDAVDTVVCAADDEWRYQPKHVEQFPDKINCVMLHLVGYILEYYYDAQTHEC